MSDFKLVEGFTIKGKSFSFNLDKGTCFYKKTGACPLYLRHLPDRMLTFIKKRNQRNLSSLKKNTITYCPMLSKNISKIHKDKIKLYLFKCGHYGFNNGQHRVCISGRLGNDLTVSLMEVDNTCSFCWHKEKGIPVSAFLKTF